MTAIVAASPGATLSAAMAIAAVGGVVRGATGFGGAMVMTPALSLLLGPVPAVLASLVLETFAAVGMLPAALRVARWRTVAPICAAAALTVPLGGHLLMSLDAGLMRRAIAATVLVFALLLLTGWRYHGRQRLATACVLGATSGVLVSATSVGGPPVIIYLLAGSDPPGVTRANLTLFITFISLVALLVMGWRGMAGGRQLVDALLLCPVFFAGVWGGSRIYGRVDANAMRRAALVFLAAVSAVVLAL